MPVATKGKPGLDKMFAASLTLKLIILYYCLKYGDVGRASRPWILGLAVAVLFTAIDLLSGYHSLRWKEMLFGSNVIASLVWMNLYYRIQNLALSILVGATGAVFILLGVPYIVGVYLV